MIVMGARVSPFVRKVLIFAAEKGIDVELQPGGFGQGGEAFEQASPFGKIPALQDGDFQISDSTAIVTYLDALHPEPNLIPTEPRARARTIWYEEFGDTIIQQAGQKIFFNRVVAPFLKMPVFADDADRAEAEEMPDIYDYLEATIPDSGFLVEDRFTLADISVACPLINVGYCSTALAGDRWPRTAAWVKGICERASIKALLIKEAKALSRMVPEK